MKRFADALYISILVLYVFAGMKLVPFHGDESTILYLSRDWYTIVNTHDLSTIFYRPTPATSADQMDQDLRLINGVVSKYMVGLVGTLSGLSADALNTPWDWSQDWWVNRYYGHTPAERALLAGRLASVWMLMTSVAVVFAIGRRLGGRGTAWLAAFVYATLPAVLLNGRRSVFEGATLLTIAAVILIGLALAQRIADHQPAPRLRCGWLLLGLIAGLAIASKHNTILVVVPIFGMMLYVGRDRLFSTIGYTLAAGVIAIGVFLVLNPAWWPVPLSMPGIVLSKRQSLVGLQSQANTTFTDVPTRVMALISYPLSAPQYYEDSRYDWTQWIGDQISTYQASGLAGIDWMRFGLLTGLLLLGGLAALRKVHRPLADVFVVVTVFTAVTTFILNPLAWQRYYLPLAVPLAILVGLGALTWYRLAAALWQQYRISRLRSSYAQQP